MAERFLKRFGRTNQRISYLTIHPPFSTTVSILVFSRTTLPIRPRKLSYRDRPPQPVPHLTRSVPDAHFTKLALSALNQVRTAMVGAPDGQDTTRVPLFQPSSNRTRRIGVETNPVFASSDRHLFFSHPLNRPQTTYFPFPFSFRFPFGGRDSWTRIVHNFSFSLSL